MDTQKTLSIRQKAASIGISATHFCDVLAGRANASVKLALEMERLEGKHFLFFLDRTRFDEEGNRRVSGQGPAAAAQPQNS